MASNLVIKFEPRAQRARFLATFLFPLGATGCLITFPPLLEDDGGAEDTTADPVNTTGALDATLGADTTDRPDSTSELPDAQVVEASLDASDEPDADAAKPRDAETTDPGSDIETGVASDTGTPFECDAGYTLCGDTCVTGTRCCDTSCEADNAQTECRDGECVVVECAEDYVDCDGAFDNGCETSLIAPEARETSAGSPLPVPKFDFRMAVSEIQPSDWEGVPRYSLNQVCSNCEDIQPPEYVPALPATNKGTLPALQDLRGTAALAWNASGLWINLVVVDDVVVTANTAGVTDARQYDNVMVVWDGDSGPSGAGSGGDHILFMGLDGALVDWRNETALLSGVATKIVSHQQCRSITLQLTDGYLANGPVQPPFSAGNRYGLNVGYNDFDWESETQLTVQRQNLVFALPMTMPGGGGDYHMGERTLSQVELVEP